jgi:hypothetical protein
MKFAPQGNGKGNYASYATVKDHIVQQIQKTFENGDDVAQSLEEMELININAFEPKREISTEKDDTEREMLQKGMDIKYQEELRRHLDRKDALTRGMNKAYAFIFTNYCTKIMQSRVEEHPDFATVIKNKPIELLKAIKTLTHDTVCAQYPYVSLTEALARLVNVKQYDNQNLLDYVKSFKQLRDVVKMQFGDQILNYFIEQKAFYRELTDDNKKTEMKNNAFERWMAYLLIRGSDQSKYGLLLKAFVSQFSLGNDQYPRTITTATDVLSNHRFDSTYHENQKRNQDKKQENRD